MKVSELVKPCDNHKPSAQHCKMPHPIYFFVDLLFKRCIFYLLERQSYRERKKERERFSSLWLTAQMAAVAGVGSGQSQEPGDSSWSPMRVQGPQGLSQAGA